MELKLPSPEQAYWGLRAMKTVAMADGGLEASERYMLESIQRIFGTVHDLEQLALIPPTELARSFPDPQLRKQLVQGLVIMTLIDGKVSPKESDYVEQFAQALEIDAPEVKNVRHVLKGEILQLRLDLVRRFWLRQKATEVWNKEGIRGLFKFVRGMMGRYENKVLAARYQGLEHCPSGSLGRSLWEYWRENGFALPGQKGGAPEQIVFHDCAHILSGYGTAPEEEVEVACFSAGFQRREPWMFVFFVLLQFHVGIRMTPITKARTGMFDPLKAMIAIRRGAAMNVDLNDDWDYWSVMEEQVEGLRRRYNILPIEAYLREKQEAIAAEA